MAPLPQILRCQYRYDPLDRLTGQVLANISERQRFYCKSRLATEIQGTLGFSIIQHDDQLLAQQQREGDLLDTTLLATDQQRSVLNTLQNDHRLRHLNYSPHGHHRFENGLLSLLRFNGEGPDPVTGHYLLGNGYRSFNPVLLIFNSPDSLSPFAQGGVNAYAYCLGDPVNQSDPTGHVGTLRIPRSTVARRRVKMQANTFEKFELTRSAQPENNMSVAEFNKNIKLQSNRPTVDIDYNSAILETFEDYNDLRALHNSFPTPNMRRVLDIIVTPQNKHHEYANLLHIAKYGTAPQTHSSTSFLTDPDWGKNIKNLPPHSKILREEAVYVRDKINLQIDSARKQKKAGKYL